MYYQCKVDNIYTNFNYKDSDIDSLFFLWTSRRFWRWLPIYSRVIYLHVIEKFHFKISNKRPHLP